MKASVEIAVEQKLLDALVGERSSANPTSIDHAPELIKMLRDGKLEDVRVRVMVSVEDNDSMNPITIASGLALISKTLNSSGRPAKRMIEKIVTIAEARSIFTEQLIDKSMSDEDFTKEAIKLAEQEGIVVIDEIDKICSYNFKILMYILLVQSIQEMEKMQALKAFKETYFL